MKKTGILLFTFAFCLLSFSAFSQTPVFKVKSFSRQPNNLAARINKRLDDNDQPCALIFVRTAETGLGFTASSGLVGRVNWKNGDYWVYVSGGNRNLKIFKKGIKALSYTFPIVPQASETYLLNLDVIRPKPKVAVWPVTILLSPPNATLLVDGKIESTQNPTHQLSEGTHTVEIKMPGYQTLKKTIRVSKTSVYYNFKLNKQPEAALMIESDPPGATVYLEGVRLGETPLSAFYPPGTYPVKVVKEGYVTIENQNLTVTSPQTRKKFILAEDAGYLTVKTYENAQVYINGKLYQGNQKLKFVPQLLNIKIAMPKAAGLEKQVVLKRNNNLTLDLYPKVQTGTLQVVVTPFDAHIVLTGDAGEHYTSDGMHIFNTIPVGSYTLKVKADGYQTVTQTVKLTVNEVLNQNIKLKKGSDIRIEMVFVKGGTFQMGSNNGRINEKPVHTVTVGDFYMGKYEVTQKQWKAVMGNNPSHWKGDDLPVELVSWNDVEKFIKKLNQKTGKHYRLPTEAEWEYAARGGNRSRGYKNAGSNTIGDVAWYNENSGQKTHPVGKKQPNELGIYDMSGNVLEWCSDWYYGNYYDSSPRNNPQGPANGSMRVLRGGSWDYNDYYCRVSVRLGLNPDNTYNYYGFRIVR